MRAIMESSFDIIYLIFVISMGIYLVKQNDEKTNSKAFGFMAILLGVGDAFHLVPRIFALNTYNGFEVFKNQLGVGKLVTSITMTIFYIILYYIYKNRYNVVNKTADISIWALAVIRIAICLMPQNQWLSSNQPVIWGVYRNIPFAIMGLMLIFMFYKSANENNDIPFKDMWFAIVLSFGFYVPVVLWGDVNPLIGLLMIPKTMAYVWIVFMGYNDYKLNGDKK